MISHFFKSSFMCRVLCVILAFLTLAFTLSPALVQPVEAVAVVDDLTLALTLLFTSWAGITFASNAGAQTAVSNLLSSKPAVASSVAGLITKGLVTEGSKLLLTGDVRTAFRDVLPDILSVFRTPENSYSGSIVGSLPLDVPLSLDFKYDNLIKEGSTGYSLDFPLQSGGLYRVVWADTFVSGDVVSGTAEHSSFGLPYDFYSWRFTLSSFFISQIEYNSKPFLGINFVFTPTVAGYSERILTHALFPLELFTSFSCTSDDASISFQRSKYINGTEAEELTWPETTITNPTDPSAPTEDGSENKIPVWPLGPQTSVITNAKTTDQADNDPGLDPEQMIEELRKLLQQQQTDPDPDPEPDPDPDPDPSDPDTPGGGDDLGQPHSADWKNVFPFCVPFDLIDFLGILAAEPEAPKFTWRFYAPPVVDEEIEIDLSVFDTVASIMRTMELLAFCVGLILLTRNIIRG